VESPPHGCPGSNQTGQFGAKRVVMSGKHGDTVVVSRAWAIKNASIPPEGAMRRRSVGEGRARPLKVLSIENGVDTSCRPRAPKRSQNKIDETKPLVTLCA
jgi:hypothetical protein